MEITNYDQTSRINHFQALEPGMYWRAKEDIEGRYKDDAVPAGTVLLLTSIDLFDGKMHTVHLDGHPLLHQNTSFSFLVDDFLSKFEFEPDAEAIRARELASLQAEVNRLQNELMEGQTNPLLMSAHVDGAVAEWEKDKGVDSTATTLPVLASQQQSMSTSVSSAISMRVTTDDVKAMQVFAERHSVIAKAQTEWIEARTTAIAGTFKKMAPFFQEKASVALARTQHVRDYVKKIMNGLESMDLYVGNGVQVETLATGESASADEKLTLFQRKLFVDEELAAWADVEDDFDFRSMTKFDECIAANPSLRDQLLPTPRSVVSVATRRSDVYYDDSLGSYEANRRNKVNKTVFLLVRDGENIHRVYSAQPTHEATPRLFPTKNELNDLFRGIDGSEITFNDIDFTKKARQSENVSLHYKRFLILLCGLDHRLNLFGQFYDPSESGKFISLEFQSRNFRFVTDDEPDFMLGENKKGVLDWIKEKNTYLQSGSRVMCYHRDLINSDTAPACERGGRYGTETRTLAEPLVDSELLIAYRDGQEICVDVRAKRETWRDVVNTHINARVSITKASYKSYLCLDAVKPSEIEHYIYNRESRIQHISFIRLFKKVASILRQDANNEKESRDYLMDCVKDAGFADSSLVSDLIDTAVRTWRAANRGKPLPLVDDKAAFHPILDQIYGLCQTAEHISRVEAFVSKQDLTPLKLVMTGRNKLILYAEVPVEQRDTRLMEWGLVKRITLNVLKTKLSVGTETLVWLTDKPNAGETVLKTYDGLDRWINPAPELCRPDKLTAHCDFVLQPMSVSGCFPASGTAIESDESIMPLELFWPLMNGFEKILDASKKTVNVAYIGVPIATYINSDRTPAGGRLETLIVYLHAANWLWNFGSYDQRQHLSKVFVSVYRNKDHAKRLMSNPVEYEIGVCTKPVDGPILLLDSGDLQCSLPPGVYDSRNLKVGEKVTRAQGASGTMGTSTDNIIKKPSLNHFMQILMKNEKFAKFRAEHRMVFNPDAWDGTRSHLEKYLHRGSMPKRAIS